MSRPVAVLGANWCGFSKKLYADLAEPTHAARLAQNDVVVTIYDCDGADKDVCQQINGGQPVNGFPTLVKTECQQISPGYKPPDAFLDFAISECSISN